MNGVGNLYGDEAVARDGTAVGPFALIFQSNASAVRHDGREDRRGATLLLIPHHCGGREGTPPSRQTLLPPGTAADPRAHIAAAVLPPRSLQFS
jgi:hypothetical protein